MREADIREPAPGRAHALQPECAQSGALPSLRPQCLLRTVRRGGDRRLDVGGGALPVRRLEEGGR